MPASRGGAWTVDQFRDQAGSFGGAAPSRSGSGAWFGGISAGSASRRWPASTRRTAPRWRRRPRRWRRWRRNALRHLHDRAANPGPDSAFDWTGTRPSTGTSSCGQHARQVRGTAGAGDDRREAALGRHRGIVEEQIRRAVRRDDARLEGHAEFLEDHGGGLHGRPVGVGAHDDADQGMFRLVLAFFRPLLSVLASSMVMVIGPTPPGTG